VDRQPKALHPSWIRLLQIELLFPASLLTLGIYHGLIQTLYRSGLIKSNSFLGLEYYQGLTLHGVVNAIVFTTMFAVAFGNTVVLFYLDRPPNRRVAWISLGMMLAGTTSAAWAILAGKASVLYTFYPPLKAHPLFYIGATFLIVGSWVSFFNWIPSYFDWRKHNPGKKTPLAIVGIFTTFIVWLFATFPLAIEVVGMLIPWSLGWVTNINVTVARTLFWFFGHPLVYFWLLPAYTMFYVMLPELAGGKLYSDRAARLTFMLFVLFSAPVGLHHQFSDPGISPIWKWLHALVTFGVAAPSFLTAFTLAASMEYGARLKGGTGYFRWWAKLPFFDSSRWLFAYFFCGLLLFLFGGITGIINASTSLNSMIHNTAWVPGHFHTTLGGPTFLSFIAMTLFLVAGLQGKEIAFPKLNIWVPYTWLVGVMIFSVGLSMGGLRGEPRRTNLGLTYTDPGSTLYQVKWKLTTAMGAIGGTIMFCSMILFFLVLVATLLRKQTKPSQLFLPTSEAYHDEPAGAFDRFRPWVIAALLILGVTYIPPFIQIFQSTESTSGAFSPNSPVSRP
jgi:cytochrome c oxidase subunit 1